MVLRPRRGYKELRSVVVVLVVLCMSIYHGGGRRYIASICVLHSGFYPPKRQEVQTRSAFLVFWEDRIRYGDILLETR